MNENHYDCIVCGVGTMGASTIYHLAKRGVSVLGLEKDNIPSMNASHHGYSRIIRLPYFEEYAYIPLLRRAFELWDELEAEAGLKGELFHKCGSLDIGPKTGELVVHSLESVKLHKIDYEYLTGSQLRSRFPGFNVPDEFAAVYQMDGGFLVPERCNVAHVQLAMAHGAKVHAQEEVLRYEEVPNGTIRVYTPKAEYTCDKLIVTVGPWLASMVPTLREHLTLQKQVLGWFQPRAECVKLYHESAFPVFVLQSSEGQMYYGFPEYCGPPGVKIGLFGHLDERATHPHELDHDVGRHDEKALRRGLEYIPAANGSLMALTSCMFTNTPDHQFIVDHHPHSPNIIIGGGFSGHGYKFASVIGEILADMYHHGTTRHDIEFLSLDRFTSGKPLNYARHPVQNDHRPENHDTDTRRSKL